MTAYLTVRQTAALAQRHPKTVALALRAGDLHGTQAGPNTTWRVRQDCAEAWIEGAVCDHKQNVTRIGKRRSA